MGKGKEAWNDTLQKLRYQHPENAEIVKEIVQNFTEADLSNPTQRKIYTERIYQCRDKKGMTLEEVGRYLGVSHPSILKQEQCVKQKGKATYIDRHYLEAFALLYEVSPTYLLGKVDDEGMYIVPDSNKSAYSPLDFDASQAVIDMTKLIIMELHNSESQDAKLNLELFDIFLTLTETTQAARDRIIKVLQLTPIIKNAEADFSCKIQLRDIGDEWMRFWVYAVPVRSSLVNWQEHFLRLGNRDINLLSMMCYLSCADHVTKEVVCTYLKEGGFLEQPRAFRQFDSP